MIRHCSVCSWENMWTTRTCCGKGCIMNRFLEKSWGLGFHLHSSGILCGKRSSHGWETRLTDLIVISITAGLVSKTKVTVNSFHYRNCCPKVVLSQCLLCSHQLLSYVSMIYIKLILSNFCGKQEINHRKCSTKKLQKV